MNGEVLGTQVTVLTYGNDEPGTGPVLHVHPYDEVFVIQEGAGALLRGGDAVIDAEARRDGAGPGGRTAPLHQSRAPGRLQTLDIHLSPRWIQTNLE